MKRPNTDVEHLVFVARVIAREVQSRIESMGLNQIEYRRDFDGVSQTDFLLAKMIGEILIENRPNAAGLVECDEERNEK